MKKILMGVVCASTMAMSGDLTKCSEAIDMTEKYLAKKYKAYEDGKKNKYLADSTSRKIQFYEELVSKWQEEAGRECKGILNASHHNYVSGRGWHLQQ